MNGGRCEPQEAEPGYKCTCKGERFSGDTCEIGEYMQEGEVRTTICSKMSGMEVDVNHRKATQGKSVHVKERDSLGTRVKLVSI